MYLLLLEAGAIITTTRSVVVAPVWFVNASLLHGSKHDSRCRHTGGAILLIYHGWLIVDLLLLLRHGGGGGQIAAGLVVTRRRQEFGMHLRDKIKQPIGSSHALGRVRH